MPSTFDFDNRIDDRSPPPRKRKVNDPKAVDSQEIRAISKSIEAFANDLIKVVANDKKGNHVVSSLSAHVALAMAAYGAKGSTREQMFKGLHLPADDKLALEGFDKFFHAINNISEVILQVANKMCISKKCTIKDDYKVTIDGIFHSETNFLDFSKPKEVVEIVNDWCSKSTRGKINEILSESHFNKDTIVIILNAVYFNGNWQKRFSRYKTSIELFHVSPTTTVEVPMMRKRRYFPYKDLVQYNAECISIPYKNHDLSMIIILPKEIDGLEHIEKNWEKINSECLNTSLFDNLKDVDLELPRFRIETSIPLDTYLCQLGVDEMFGSEANFKGISDAFFRITGAAQTALIEVNEEGTEAAAVTRLVGGGCGSPPKLVKFYVNRPFLFQIYDRNLEVSLFSGRIVNPIGK
ncbi:hypothetical protein QAD02_004132 [Eretmocerus hayati]|uniref:Uncharacterized protein n=1 Tax=Eretmocerus hayati TaxID=131215 RepID=A0ACC2NPR0_9HYME|nr:hypothetical protein QAD02_004132 [Eretmocerus hayati]